MSDTEKLCATCSSSKVTAECGECHVPLCRKCARFLEEGSFSFFSKEGPELKHTWYCVDCDETILEPARATLAETREKAEDVLVFFTTQKRNPPLLGKAKSAVKVDACPDRDETILRLAYMAAEQGFNAIIEVEVESAKVRNEGWQTSVWKGTGVPAQVNPDRIP